MTAALAGLVISGDAEGWTEDKYNKNKDEYELLFPESGGENDSAAVILPADVPVYYAKMGISGHPDGEDRYPTGLWADVGRDGDVEWRYDGTGYGRLGMQNKFMDNSSHLKIPFRQGGSNNSYSFYLPKNAGVSEATVRMTGSAGMNDGMAIVRQGGVALDSLIYSSAVWTDSWRPKLTIEYQTGSPTVLQPDEAGSKDTRAQAGQPDTNYNTGTTNIYLGYGWPSSTWGDSIGFIQFDLSSAPLNPTVTNAELEVYCYTYGTGRLYGIHGVMEEWDEDTLTWNNMPAYGAVPDAAYNTTSATWETQTFDITDLVDFWLSDQYPADVQLDLGMDSVVEYSMTGELDQSITTPDFANKLNGYLQNAPTAFTDEYGNSFVEVHMDVASTQSGYIELDQLNIRYDWTARIFKNPHNFNLTNEVVELMDSIPPVAGMVSIPVEVHSDTPGLVELSGLNVTYNGAPRTAGELPDGLSVDEDTSADHLMDLSLYFDDDYMAPADLKYKVTKNSRDGTIGAEVVDGHYLKIDASTSAARDFNGNLTVIVEAKDDMGFTTESPPIPVTIAPVNDEPVKGSEPIPDIKLKEGGSSNPLDLTSGDYFYDVEADELFFWAVVDPQGSYDGEDITADIDNMTKTMVITGNGDFFGEEIPVRVHCDDSGGVEAAASWIILVDVANVNDDAPVWGPLAAIHINEDSVLEDAFNIHDQVHDIDNDVSSLRFNIPPYANDEFVKARLDAGGYVDIMAVGDNWTGEAAVTITATDDGDNTGVLEFEVIVAPVNDAPVAGLKGPARGSVITAGRVTLSWEGIDAETPAEELVYNVYMGAKAADTLIAEGLQGNELEVAVEDGHTYHWAVAPADGMTTGALTGERTFTVDFSAGPRTSLISPLAGTVIKEDSITLQWGVEERPGGKGGPITYTVYLGESEDGLEPVAEGLTGTQYTADGLKDRTIYNWKVIPFDGKGEGTCRSGVLTFFVNSDFEGYSLELTLSPETVTLKPGELGAFTATLGNTGAGADIYALSADMSDVPGARIELSIEDSGRIPLEKEGSVEVLVTVEIPGSTAPGTYTLTVTAISLKGGSEGSGEAEVNVDTGKGTVDDITEPAGASSGDEEDSSLWVMLILLIAVMAAVMGSVGVMYRKKSQRVSELEGLRSSRKATVVEAELTVSPGAAGLTSLQLGTGGVAAAAAGPVPLALPRVASGGAAPEATATGVIDITGLKQDGGMVAGRAGDATSKALRSQTPTAVQTPAPPPSAAGQAHPKPSGAPGPAPTKPPGVPGQAPTKPTTAPGQTPAKPTTAPGQTPARPALGTLPGTGRPSRPPMGKVTPPGASGAPEKPVANSTSKPAPPKPQPKKPTEPAAMKK